MVSMPTDQTEIQVRTSAPRSNANDIFDSRARCGSSSKSSPALSAETQRGRMELGSIGSDDINSAPAASPALVSLFY
jgi:hypothetical protein